MLRSSKRFLVMTVAALPFFAADRLSTAEEKPVILRLLPPRPSPAPR